MPWDSTRHLDWAPWRTVDNAVILPISISTYAAAVGTLVKLASSKICARPQNIAGAFRMTPVETPYLSIDLRRNMVIKNAALRLY